MNIEKHTSTFEALIVYDSVRAGKRAKEFCDRLGQRLAPGCELNLSVWSLSALGIPAVARAAAREAERATLLIVAVNGDKRLPRPVRNCLHWCARRIHPTDGALVAQLHGILKMKKELCQACGCLREIAHHAGVHFFLEVVELPEDQLDYTMVHHAAIRAEAADRAEESTLTMPAFSARAATASHFDPPTTMQHPSSYEKTATPETSVPILQVNENISLEEQIAQRAHERWRQRDCKAGDELADWFQAEREVNEWHQQRLGKKGTTS